MASASDLSALKAHLDAVSDLMSGDLTWMGHAVGKGGRTIASEVSRSVTGGDMRLSHMGRRGVRLGMRYDLDNKGATVTMKLIPSGAWVLTERGAKPHTIPRSAFRGRGRKATRRYIYGGYGHPVTSVDHPGAPGKSSIKRAFGKMRTQAPKDAHDAYLDKLGAIYG